MSAVAALMGVADSTNSAAPTATSAPKSAAEAEMAGRPVSATSSLGQAAVSAGALADSNAAETEGRTTRSGASGTVGRVEVGSTDLLQPSGTTSALGRVSAPPLAAESRSESGNEA